MTGLMPMPEIERAREGDDAIDEAGLSGRVGEGIDAVDENRRPPAEADAFRLLGAFDPLILDRLLGPTYIGQRLT